MLYKGLKFGMILQLAIGPICLLVFNTSIANGLASTLLLIVAITAVDAFFIALASVGIAAFINKPKIKKSIQLIGCAVLVLFGLDILFGAFEIALFPSFSFFSDVSNTSLIVQGIVLTASNPLTIIFWGGVFAAQISKNNFDKKQLVIFGAGCALSTLLFLIFIAVLGVFAGKLLPSLIIRILNVTVGVGLIFFGLKLLLKKDKSKEASI
jgi:threonine/homoserine/homoserine lactone efflux protein